MKRLTLLMALLVAIPAHAEDVFLRTYGQATTINFALYATDGSALVTNAVYASGDVKIMKDDGTPANVASGFVDEGQTYSQPLSAAEMSAGRIVLEFVDQTGPQAWLDKVIIIETTGFDGQAQHSPIRRD